MNKIYFLIFIVIMTVSCNSEPKYDWLPMLSVPREYPVWLFSGILTYPEKDGVHILPWRLVMSEWGEECPVINRVGPDLKRVPDGLGLRWYSYIEKKFYSGFINLPKEKMEVLFAEGFINTRKQKDTFYRILVGMAPCGVVNVWLYGGGTVVEIGSYTVEEFQPDDINNVIRDGFSLSEEEFEESNRRMLLGKEWTSIWNNAAKKPIPCGLWDVEYRHKCQSRTIVNHQDNIGVVDIMIITYLNGERETLIREDLYNLDFKVRPCIKSISLDWSSDRLIKRGEIQFDSDEVMEAYSKAINSDRPCEWIIDINKENDHIKVYFHIPGEYRQKLLHSKIGHWTLSECHRYLFDAFKNDDD
ncbi:DUF2931 family protein [Bacteroides sp. 224]|uniref:DUF2931 family protein n=1 Tax=Bacteroides sp. 224 TaxID=2302936 RepID=UPI0013D1FF60|nr:DUF2931 family protein [Bacteroides sp. 224]NDV66562.1 DUF2931 family protein [Bacteroides sp. 224]